MKAILVIDMPNDMTIEDCWITYVVCNDEDTKSFNGVCLKTLRPMPEKKEIFDGTLTYDKLAEYIGYNKCVGELLGENDESDISN